MFSKLGFSEVERSSAFHEVTMRMDLEEEGRKEFLEKQAEGAREEEYQHLDSDGEGGEES